MMRPDYILVFLVAILILLGIIILASVSTALSQEKFGSSTFFLFRHILIGLLPGFLFGFLAFKIPMGVFRKWAPVLLLINLIAMVLVFVPKVGVSMGGASRWLNLGFIYLQPSEFLKLSFIIYLAAWLSTKKEKPTAFFTFLLIVGVVSLLLIFQPDIGTLGVIIFVGILMYFLARTPLKHTIFLITGSIAVLTLLIKIAPYRLNRLLVFLKPDIDPMGISYQIKQALIAIGSGGIVGKGLGMSIQKFGFLPQQMADSIFAIFAEEVGFVGGSILIFLFLFFAWRGFAIARKAQNEFCKLTALGITCWIILQAFINIGSMIGILPLTGIPLPFISYGGSALVAELIGVGILLNISKKQ